MKARTLFIGTGAGSMPRHITLMWLVFLSIVGFALRYSVLDRSNLDIVTYSLPWLGQLRELGFWKGIAHPFSELSYPPFYAYAMGLANSLLPPETDGKSVMKAIPIVFDFVTAGLVFAIAGLRWGAGWHRIAAYASILFAPTILLNGAYWGQSDIIYTSFLLAFVYFLLRRSDFWAMVCFGMALSVKLQAIWIGPFVLMMVIRNRIRWWLLLLPAVVYFVVALPTLFVGRSVAEVAGIYLTQVGSQSLLTYSAANLQFFPHYFFYHLGWWPALIPLIAKASILLAMILSLLFAWRASRGRLNDEMLLVAVVVSELLVPQFLPYMHNRYFFAADVFIIVLAVWNNKYWPAAVLMQFNSVVTYISFLWGSILLEKPVPGWLKVFGLTNNLQWVTGLIAAAAICNFVLLLWFWRRLRMQLSDAPIEDHRPMGGVQVRT